MNASDIADFDPEFAAMFASMEAASESWAEFRGLVQSGAPAREVGDAYKAIRASRGAFSATSYSFRDYDAAFADYSQSVENEPEMPWDQRWPVSSRLLDVAVAGTPASTVSPFVKELLRRALLETEGEKVEAYGDAFSNLVVRFLSADALGTASAAFEEARIAAAGMGAVELDTLIGHLAYPFEVATFPHGGLSHHGDETRGLPGNYEAAVNGLLFDRSAIRVLGAKSMSHEKERQIAGVIVATLAAGAVVSALFQQAVSFLSTGSQPNTSESRSGTEQTVRPPFTFEEPTPLPFGERATTNLLLLQIDSTGDIFKEALLREAVEMNEAGNGRRDLAVLSRSIDDFVVVLRSGDYLRAHEIARDEFTIVRTEHESPNGGRSYEVETPATQKAVAVAAALAYRSAQLTGDTVLMGTIADTVVWASGPPGSSERSETNRLVGERTSQAADSLVDTQLFR